MAVGCDAAAPIFLLWTELENRLGPMLGDVAAIKVRWWSENQRVLAVCKAHRAPRSDLARDSR